MKKNTYVEFKEFVFPNRIIYFRMQIQYSSTLSSNRTILELKYEKEQLSVFFNPFLKK